MKWFGEEWQRASEAKAARIEAQYREHLEALSSSLPTSLHLLSHFHLLSHAGGSLSIHDGRIMSAFWELDAEDTFVVDIYVGEDDPPDPGLISVLLIRICYRDARLKAPKLTELRRLIRDPKTQILYGEVDSSKPGRFEHRMSLWTGKQAPNAELAVRFSDADIVAARLQGSTLNPA